MSDDTPAASFLSQLRGNLQHATQWLPKGAIKPNQVQSSDTIGKVLTTTENGAEWQTASSGVTDHGLLTGLGDDDHPQYHNDARGDARYQPLDSDLTTIAGLTATSDSFMQAKAGAWAARTVAQVVTDLNAGGLALTSALSSYLTTAAAASTYLPLAGGTLTGALLMMNSGIARRNTGDTQDRMSLSSSGIFFGSGSTAADTGISRTGAGILSLESGNQLRSDTDPSNLQDLARKNYVDTKAPIASPALTGTPTAPTAAEGTNTTQIASTEYVDRATGNASTSRPSARASRTTTQSISTATWTAISWTVEDFDTDGMYSTGTNPTRITVQTPGTYVIEANTTITNSAGGSNRVCRIYKNGTAITNGSQGVPGSAYAHLEASVIDQAVAGDYYELFVYQDSGGSLNAIPDGSAYPSRFSAAWVGGTGAAWGNAGASAYQNAALNHTSSGNWQAVTWDSELWDIDGFHSTSSNTDRFTCITPGKYLVTAMISFASNTTGRRLARIKKVSAGGTTTYHGYAEKDPISGDVTPVTTTAVVDLSAGDYVIVDAFQNSGGNLGYQVGAATNGSMQLSIVRVGYQTNPADLPGTYVAKMVAANSGSPTHTSNGGWQKVGSGGGTLTWTSEIDKRPSGVSAQVDTSTNKRIDIRKTGLYRVGWGGSFSAISDGKILDFGLYKNGAHIYGCGATTGVAATPQMHRSEIVSLTSGDYLELYAFQNDSVSEAYYTAAGYQPHIQIEYLGPAT